MVVKLQNQIFNMNFVKYLIKVDGKDGKFFIGVFTNIDDKEFYFEYPSVQRRNEDWDRIDRELTPSLNIKSLVNG
ncbi:MAG TPA: hypothetical protein PKD83_04885 [Ignavibacteria bacterium]|nr:hypothetical protein [Ignavibacteria bacterium]